MTEPRLPGERLREERVRQGLSEDDISARLRLSRTYLRALESDDYERLPQPAFVRGYLRNYARLLELPAEEVVSEYQRLVDEQAPVPAETDAQGEGEPGESLPAWAWPAGGVALVLVVALLWLAGDRGGDNGVAEREVAAPEQEAREDEAEDPSTEADADLAEVEPLEPPEGLSDDGREGPEEEVAQVEPEEAPDELRMRFDEECWLEVHEVDSGDRIYQGNQDAGGELTVAGRGPFRVTLGNAPALSALEFNGEEQDLPGRGGPGQVIRITVP